jgi:hypothetical protein
MAKDNMMAGLFSTPEQYQQQQNMLALSRASELAQLTPEQRANTAMGYAGYMGAGALGQALGAQDPQLKLQSMRQQILQGTDQTDPNSLAQAAQALNQAGDTAGARQLAQLAQEAALKQSQITKNMREGRAASNKVVEADGRQVLVNTVSGEKIADIGAAPTKDTTGNSEFERTLKGLNLTPEQERAFKTQRLNALLNNDSSGIKAITAQLASLQLQTQQFKFDEEKKKSAAERQTAITKLATVENDIDESLTTAAKAIKLAPNSFLGAAGQEVGGVIPWTDQRALKNLVSSLNSDKAIGTLQELKTQSKTGATGFGALNTKELQLILDKTRALDPADKMFRENLTTVMNGWQKLKTQSAASRENLMGAVQQTPPALAPNPEAWIKKNLEGNKGYSRDYVIRQGIEAGRLPKDYK